VSAAFAQEAPKNTAPPKIRKVEVTYESTISDIPAGSKLLKVWLPMPRHEKDGLQEIMSAKLDAGAQAKVAEKTDAGGENHNWYVEVADPPPSVTLKATMQVARAEQINNHFAGAGAKALSAEDRERLKDALAPNAKVPTSGDIVTIADKVVPA